jgi:hypothetical protein
VARQWISCPPSKELMRDMISFHIGAICRCVLLDSGNNRAHSGNFQEDSGNIRVDRGKIREDSGNIRVDSGNTRVD